MVNKSAVSLALGFVGSSEVNNKTSLSLVADLIKGHRRANPKSDVTFVVLGQPFTQTLVDLSDYALANGHDLVVVASESEIAGGESSEAIESFTRVDGVLSVPVVDDYEEGIAHALVGNLLEHGEDQRLIIIDDPSADGADDAYNALLAAHEAGIVTRSLLDGLDRVFFEGEEETLPDDDDDTEEVATDDEDGDVPDLEDLEAGVDDDEIKEYDDDDTEPGEAEEPEPEPAPVKKAAAKKAAAPVKAAPAKKAAAPKAATSKDLTEDGLIKFLEDQGVEAFYALAAEYGVFPGKGVKKPVMIARILKAAGVDSDEPAAAAPAPAKKAAAPVKAAPVKKAAPAKVAAPVKTAAPKPPVPTAAPSSDLESRVEKLERALAGVVEVLETILA